MVNYGFIDFDTANCVLYRTLVEETVRSTAVGTFRISQGSYSGEVYNGQT
jgi:hypothetical protein